MKKVSVQMENVKLRNELEKKETNLVSQNNKLV